MKLFLGLDGGGTKTDLTVINEQQEIQLRVRGKGTNPHLETLQTASAELTSLLEQIIHSPQINPQQISGLCLGMSGVHTEEEKQQIIQVIKTLQVQQGIDYPISFQNEGQIALMATTGSSHGVVVISGTGSIVYGFDDQGEYYRTGGWGHLLGDEGSGYRIGLLGLQAIMRSYDGIIARTMITPLIQEAWNLENVLALRTLVYQTTPSKIFIASAAPYIIQAADEGDPIALRIIMDEAEQLALTTIALIRKYDYFASQDIVLSGSIFQHSRLFAEIFTARVQIDYPTSNLINSNTGLPAADGAALLARQLWSTT